MNWMDKTIQELAEICDQGEMDAVVSFVKMKLLESYKNGAASERRKAHARKRPVTS